MKLLYKPMALIAKTIASRVGKSAFRGMWSRLDEGDPPAATAQDATLPKVLQATVLEAATMAASAAVAERAAASTFHYLFGVWPEGKDKKK